MKFFQKPVLFIIKFFRTLFLHTPVSRWKITGKLREFAYKSVVKGSTLRIEYQGIVLEAPSSDLGLVPGLVGGYYEHAEIELFKVLASKSKLILDVGGNIGLYSVVGAKCLPKNGKIICFEPIPSNIEMLENNIALNNAEKSVIVEQYAVGSAKKKLDIYISEKSFGNHSVGEKNAGSGSEKLSVQQIKLDDYVSANNLKKVDILKIDIEGYDAFAFSGAKKLVKDSSPALFIEFMPDLMKNCGVKASEFGEKLYNSFEYCYVIDETKDEIKLISKDSLEVFIKKISNNNLLLINREDQNKLVQPFIK